MNLETNKNVLKLKQIGIDQHSRPVFIDADGRLYKDVNLGMDDPKICTVWGGFDGEPDTPLEYFKQRPTVEIVENLEVENEMENETIDGYEDAFLSLNKDKVTLYTKIRTASY